MHHEVIVEDDDEGDGEEESRCRVFIIAATNRPDLMDKALLRPGRVEKHLYCGQPSEIERGDILLRNLRSFPCGPASSDNNVTVEKDEEALGGDESLEEVVDWVCKQDKAAACVSADFSALANSAFLEATSEVTHTADDSNGIKAIIRARHVRAAFETLRPSLSTKDLSFYQRIHDKFGGEHTLVSNATASSRPLARAPASPTKSGPRGFDRGRGTGAGIEDNNYYGMLGYVPVYSSSPLRKPYGATGHVAGYAGASGVEGHPATSMEGHPGAIMDADQSFDASECRGRH